MFRPNLKFVPEIIAIGVLGEVAIRSYEPPILGKRGGRRGSVIQRTRFSDIAAFVLQLATFFPPHL